MKNNWRSWWFSVWLCSFGSAHAAVELPTGLYQVTAEDLRIKVPGGFITAERTWYNGEWHFSSAWNKLKIELNAADGSVRSIIRNGDVYAPNDDGTRFIFDERNSMVPITGGFRWEDREGNWNEYRADGQITRYGNSEGATASFDYDAQDRRVGVFDRNGRQVLWYEYTDGRLSAIRDGSAPAPRRVTYHYQSDMLSEVVDVRGQHWRYQFHLAKQPVSIAAVGDVAQDPLQIDFDSVSLMTEQIDPLGRITAINQDISGRVSKVAYPDGTSTTYVYDYDSTRKEYYSRTTEPGGKVIERWYDKTSEVIRTDINGRTVERIRRDGRKRIFTDGRGLETVKEYDEWDNLIKVTHPDGSTEIFTIDPNTSTVLQKVNERGVITAYTYTDGKLTRLIEAKGTSAERITEYVYDSEGNPSETKKLSDANTAEAVTVFSDYDEAGNARNITDPEGGVHRYTYDIAGNVLTYTDPRGNTWTRTYDAAGKLLTVTDPLGATTTFGYDAIGRLTKRIGPAPVHATTEYGYDQRDRLITLKDAAGVTRYTRDAAGRLQTLVDAAGKVLVQENVYDGEGHLLRHTDGAGNTTSYEYEGDYPGLLNSITFPTYKVRYAYDKRNRPTAETDDLGEQGTRATRRTYTPDGLLETLTDAKNRTTAYEYDALGRETVTTDPLGGATRLVYDDRDNVISVTNARDIVIRRYEYDRKDRLTKEIWPDGRFYRYIYDDNTGITERIDAKGQKARYHHDEAGRQTRIEYFGAGSDTATKAVTFTYDERGLLTGYNDGTTSAIYSYDALGRKTGETVNYGSFSLGFGYGYDAAGRKTRFTGPDQNTVTYAYDQAGQFTTISVPDAGTFTLSDYQWNAPQRLSLPGGGTREWEYDALLRPARITGKDPAGNPVLDYAYTFDPVGNILGKQTEHGAYAYGYDDLDRLTRADNPTLLDEAYTYDPVGNRLTDAKTTGTWAYSDSDELKSYGDVSLQYDLNGSLKEKNDGGTVVRYAYNLENRLAEVRDGAYALNASYYYDPFGRRLWKEVGGTRTFFLYADEGLVAEADSSGTVVRQYGWKPDGTWGTDPLYLKAGGQTYFYQNDHLGTPQKLVGLNGAMVWAGNYEAFGAVRGDVGQVENPLRFPGQYHDQETGLNYNYHRTYDPSIGRYLESDPIGLNGGLNTYLYATANPLRFIDPDGLRYSPYEHGMDWDGNPVQPPVAYQCAKAVAAKYSPLLMNDKYKHCMVAGEIYQTCGVLTAHVASIGKEIQDVFGPGNAEWGDLEADYAGIDCAKNPECGESLGECCKRKGYAP